MDSLGDDGHDAAMQELSDSGWDDAKSGDEQDSDWPMLDDSEVTDRSLVLSRLSSYDILSEEDLLQRQKALTERIVEQLNVSMIEAKTLLQYYRWNVQKLVDDWLESSEKVKESTGACSVQLQPSNGQALFNCILCVETRTINETLALSCGHRYCTFCWSNWINAEFEKGPAAVLTPCPSFKCGKRIPDIVMLDFLFPERRSNYKQWVLDVFVQGDRSLKWCPSARCDKVAEYKSGGEMEIECRCGYVFCFKCLREGHRPCSCEVVDQWDEKNSTDSENVNWIIANTKRCPKCDVNIEKNQGCNHMTCRSCKHEFCWLCKGDWAKHGQATGGYYRCNKYEEVKEKPKGAPGYVEEEQRAREARNALQKYMFYFTRYDNHGKSIRWAEKTRVEAETRMQSLRDVQGSNYQDVQFILNAVNAVISCRRVLKWSYAYGFYLGNPMQKLIFEQHQERLEKFTEHLHGLSEKPIKDLQDNRLRADTVNYTRVVLRYRQNVLKAIEDGLEWAGDD